LDLGGLGLIYAGRSGVAPDGTVAAAGAQPHLAQQY